MLHSCGDPFHGKKMQAQHRTEILFLKKDSKAWQSLRVSKNVKISQISYPSGERKHFVNLTSKPWSEQQGGV